MTLQDIEQFEASPVVKLIVQILLGTFMLVLGIATTAVYDGQRDVEARLKSVEVAVTEFRIMVVRNSADINTHALSVGHEWMRAEMDEVQFDLGILEYRLNNLPDPANYSVPER